MLAVNYSTLRNNLKMYCDKVTNDFETVIVTRKDEKNVVIISLEDYNALVESRFIASNKKCYDCFVQSSKKFEQSSHIDYI